MSPVMVEHVVTGDADSEFYSGAPALSAYHRAVHPLMPSDPQDVPIPHVVVLAHRRHPRWMSQEISTIGRTAWPYAKAKYLAAAHSGSFVLRALDATGPFCQRVLDLVGELASRPQSYAPVSSQPTQGTEIETHVEDIVETVAAGYAHSFPSSTGGRVMFSDIEVSSDEDLNEAGYPYYSNLEDPELAAQSRRNFLNRMGLGSR